MTAKAYAVLSKRKISGLSVESVSLHSTTKSDVETGNRALQRLFKHPLLCKVSALNSLKSRLPYRYVKYSSSEWIPELLLNQHTRWCVPIDNPPTSATAITRCRVHFKANCAFSPKSHTRRLSYALNITHLRSAGAQQGILTPFCFLRGLETSDYLQKPMRLFDF